MSFLDQQLDSSDDEDETSFYRHSDRNFDAIVAEQRRLRKEQQEEGERVRLGSQASNDQSRKREIEEEDDVTEPLDSTKRQRSSNSPRGSPAPLRSIEHRQSLNASHPDVTSSTSIAGADALGRTTDNPAWDNGPQQDSAVADVIALEDDDEPDSLARLSPAETPESDIDESDEELAAIMRQARRAHRLKKSASGREGTPQATNNTQGGPVTSSADHAKAEPVVELFLTSHLPNTKPLRIKIRLSQQLGIVRQTWCAKQGLSDETINGVFLVYQLRRLYDVSTCRSIGLDIDADGGLIMKGANIKDDTGKIHLQAVNEEIFAELKDGTLDVNGAHRSTFDEEMPAQPDEDIPEETSDNNVARQQSVSLVLRTKNREDFRLMAKPGTSIGKIVNAYKKMNRIDADTHVSLSFDGETLPAATFVRDTELTDMDIVDVHVG